MSYARRVRTFLSVWATPDLILRRLECFHSPLDYDNPVDRAAPYDNFVALALPAIEPSPRQPRALTALRGNSLVDPRDAATAAAFVLLPAAVRMIPRLVQGG